MKSSKVVHSKIFEDPPKAELESKEALTGFEDLIGASSLLLLRGNRR